MGNTPQRENKWIIILEQAHEDNTWYWETYQVVNEDHKHTTGGNESTKIRAVSAATLYISDVERNTKLGRMDEAARVLAERNELLYRITGEK